MGLLRQACELEDPADGPGLVLLDASGALAGMNDAAGRWLEAAPTDPTFRSRYPPSRSSCASWPRRVCVAAAAGPHRRRQVGHAARLLDEHSVQTARSR